MKLVWLVNTALPQINEARGEEVSIFNGWTQKLAGDITDKRDVSFYVFYPRHEPGKAVYGRAGRINYIGFYEEAAPELEYNKRLEGFFTRCLKSLKPDIVHIWGTEYVHTLCMVNAAERLGIMGRVLLSVQGVMYMCGRKYRDFLPDGVVHSYTLRDFIRRDNIYEQQYKFLKRSCFETEALKKIENVTGRTDWDRKMVLNVNPDIRYFRCGEILRPEFYGGVKWRYEDCGKYSIFISQAGYTIKGLHTALGALGKLREKYPEMKVYVGGDDLTIKSFRDCLKTDSYRLYINRQIKKHGLKDVFVFTGRLGAREMREMYLRANVYLQTSVLENSSNSLGEAMILGLPCVASDVGGTSSMLNDGEDGFLYECGSDADLIGKISGIFDNEAGLEALSRKAVKTASRLYDPDKNSRGYFEIYDKLMGR